MSRQVDRYRHYMYEFNKNRSCAMCPNPIKNNNKSGYCIHHFSGNYLAKTVYVNCAYCGGAISRSPSTVGKRNYCNYKCSRAASKGTPNKNHPMFGKGMPDEHLKIRIVARNVLNKALLRNEVLKSPCADCRNIKVEAHHDDYSKPLDVIWLCRRHHSARHKGVNSYVSKYISR